MSLGYGHLLGALWFGWDEFRSRLDGPLVSGLGMTLALSVLGTALVAYAALLVRWPAVAAPLLGLSLWHALENDAALAHFYAGLRRPARRCGAAMGLAILGSAAAAKLLIGAPSRVVGIGFVELFAAPILYHLVSWLLLAVERTVAAARDGRGGRRRATRLAALHAVPAVVCATAAAAGDAAPGLREAVLNPGLYLFWAGLHVLQTAWARRGSAQEEIALRQCASTAASAASRP